MLNAGVDVVLVLILLYSAFMTFTQKSKSITKFKGQYTEESIRLYSIWSGIASLVAAVYCAGLGVSEADILPLHLDPGDKSTAFWIFTGICLAIVIFMMAFGRYKVLKPIGSGNGKSGKKAEDEDY